METLYKWRVQEKDKLGRMRWRLVRSPMTEETARFWAANNNRVIQRVDMPADQPFQAGSQARPIARLAAKS